MASGREEMRAEQGGEGVVRDVLVADAARSLGFTRRQINNWCSKGVGGEVCPSVMVRKGKQDLRCVNVEEVKAWRRSVGMVEDRNALFNEGTAGGEVAPAPAAPAVVEAIAVGEIDDVDASLRLVRALFSQLREQVQRIADKPSDQVTSPAIKAATDSAKQISQELRQLLPAIAEREAAADAGMPRKQAMTMARTLVETFTGGLMQFAVDLPAEIRVGLEQPGGDRIAAVVNADLFDRLVALACESVAARVRSLLAGALADAGRELQIGHERPDANVARSAA